MEKKKNQMSFRFNEERMKSNIDHSSNKQPIPEKEFSPQYSSLPEIEWDFPSNTEDKISFGQESVDVLNHEKWDEPSTYMPSIDPPFRFSREHELENGLKLTDQPLYVNRFDESTTTHSYRTSAPLPKRYHKPKKKMPALGQSTKLIMVAGSAIVLGILLGLSVLAVFSNLSEPQGEAHNGPGQSPSISQSANGEGQQSSGSMNQNGSPSHSTPKDQSDLLINPSVTSPTGSINIGNVQLPIKSYHVVQAGAFSEKQAAEVMLQQLLADGYPGIIRGEQAPFQLLVGIADSKEEAQKIGQYYESQNYEIYVKDWNVTEPGNLSLSEGQAKQLAAFLAQGEELFQLTSKASIDRVEGATPITSQQWEKLQLSHRQFLQLGKGITDSWENGTAKNGVEQISKSIIGAINALESYRQEPHQSYLWNVQQALLEFSRGYESLVTSI
ncbi:SPOR domain-containing protein [Bacillus horti]|uniref:SPOR domain-containing protein n=1 Tax=Caldalkalibacillus horti TaxID=77523 RepID=A0ABT9VTJ4_9BACI|nr:SPOR domain-containing protein [Bacillus horti]MDQ0164294.1 hypothetical protein [Bacillus horti]